MLNSQVKALPRLSLMETDQVTMIMIITLVRMQMYGYWNEVTQNRPKLVQEGHTTTIFRDALETRLVALHFTSEWLFY